MCEQVCAHVRAGGGGRGQNFHLAGEDGDGSWETLMTIIYSDGRKAATE